MRRSLIQEYAAELRDASGGRTTHLQEMALRELEQGNNSDLLQEAASTSDFPALLRNTMHKGMLKAWNNYPITYENIVSDFMDVKDFKDIYRERISDAEGLLPVREHGEYKDSDLLEEEIKFKVQKFGRKFSVSWETLVNDDMNQIRQTPEKMGKAAARTLDESVWAYVFGWNLNTMTFEGTSGVDGGPTIYDNARLFCLAHKNKLTAAATNTLTEANLGTAYKAMRTQKDLRGHYVRVTPQNLIIPPALEIQAWKVLTGEIMPLLDGTSTYTANQPNFFKGKLNMMVNQYVPSDTAWYLMADPKQMDTVVVAFLRGRRQPETFEQDIMIGAGFERDEIVYKIRHVWGREVIDFRPFYQGSE